MVSRNLLGPCIFQSTPSTRRVTEESEKLDPGIGISIHTLHTEGDGISSSQPHFPSRFQSTPSTRRVTDDSGINITTLSLFQSTPSTRRVTDQNFHFLRHFLISIHTLHTEGDAYSSSSLATLNKFQSTPSTRRVTERKCCRSHHASHFNPHPPHGG